jgi:EAL domain-containing protein (putative c-di-GMP-specific phosphodiesterase class I)
MLEGGKGAELLSDKKRFVPANAVSAARPRDFVFDADFLDHQLKMLDLGPCQIGPEGLIACDFMHFSLGSAFQPIVGAKDRLPHSFEALLRGRLATGAHTSPVEIFECAWKAGEERRLDRAARLIHVANFYAQMEADARLFLNVHGQHIEKRDVAHGEFFAAALAGQGLKAEAVTIEILESSIDDFDALIAAVSSYKAFGFRVAIDDFGARHSNFDRVWRLNPDYVKIDRSLVAAAATNPRARIVLPKIIEIVHDLGAQVVCEGIEDAEQERVVLGSGADFLQGYLYGRPKPVISRVIA